MKLTDRIVERCLSKKLKILESRNMGVARSLCQVLLFDPAEELEKNYIYIVEDPQQLFSVKRIPKDILLIILGEIPDWMLSGISCIVLPEDTRVSDVLNCVVHSFSRIDEWKESMDAVQRQMGTVEELLHIGSYYMGNPMLVFRDDTSVMALAYQGEKPEYIEKLEDQAENMQYINALIQDERYSESLKYNVPYWGLELIPGTASLNWNIKKNGETVYVLVVPECDRKLTEADGDVLMLMGEYITSFLLIRGEYGTHKEDALHKALLRAITDKDADYMELSWELENLGWQRNHRYLCLVFESAFIDQGKAPISQICNYMENQIKGCSSFSYKNKVINYLDLNLMDRPLKNITSDVTPFIRDSFLKAGYSRIMTGHMNLRRQYLQSRIALDEGSKKKPYLWIHYFDQIARYYIMDQITRVLPADMVCHERLLELQRFDQQHNTEYMVSLRAYLDNQQNAVRTARALSIHRSTFLYRLEKIVEITGLDLEDPEEVLYLSMSFRILERERTEAERKLKEPENSVSVYRNK